MRTRTHHIHDEKRYPMRPILALLLTALLAAPALAQDAAHAYAIYRADGTPASFAELSAAMDEADVIFVGEVHDDPAAHALQAAIWDAALAKPDRPAVLSLEMFARDAQPVLDEYLADLITERHFLAAASPWPSYAEDYRPMVEAAKSAGAPVVAANAPRRYANRVSRLGIGALADLSDAARATLAPIPFSEPTAAYRAKWDALMSEMMGPMHGDASADTTEAPASPPPSPHGAASMPSMDNMLAAQNTWDATMAHSITLALLRQPSARVVHLVGGFHVEGGSGTPEHLARYRPGTRILVVSAQPADDPAQFEVEHTGAGDFVVQTPASGLRSAQTAGG